MIKKTVILTMTIVLMFCQGVQASNVSENEVKATIVKHSIDLGIEPALALSIAQTQCKKPLWCCRRFPINAFYSSKIRS